MPTMTVAGHQYRLDPRGVEVALQGELPEPLYEHFVVINGRRWPPKQVLALVTGLDRADFTTHQARRALTRLGFPAGRVQAPGDVTRRRPHPLHERPLLPTQPRTRCPWQRHCVLSLGCGWRYAVMTS